MAELLRGPLQQMKNSQPTTQRLSFTSLHIFGQSYVRFALRAQLNREATSWRQEGDKEIENGSNKGFRGTITQQKADDQRRIGVHYENHEYYTDREGIAHKVEYPLSMFNHHDLTCISSSPEGNDEIRTQEKQ